MKRNMFTTLIHLRGNPRACVYTEPMWGIPFNLYSPFVSVYMLALGVKDVQIGIIASVAMLSQIVFSLFGGVITDKLGRRKTTLIFDIIAWTIPSVIWAVSQSYLYFVVAAFVNGVMKVTQNSWNCLLVEDADKEEIVSVYSWVYISAVGAAFFAPISGLLVQRIDLIPAVRILYIFGGSIMTLKFILLFIFSTETKQGRKRIEETKGVPLGVLLKGYGPVLVQIMRTPQTLVTLGIMVIIGIFSMVNTSFWSVLVTRSIGIPESMIGIFSFVKSVVMLIFYFIVVPKLSALRFRRPMLLGFITLMLSQSLLLFAPKGSYVWIIVSLILEAASLSLINPLLDSLQVIMVDPQERARIIAIMYVVVLACTSPFGWIAGHLSEMSRHLPFVMNIILLFLGLLLTHLVTRLKEHKAVEGHQ